MQAQVTGIIEHSALTAVRLHKHIIGPFPFSRVSVSNLWIYKMNLKWIDCNLPWALPGFGPHITSPKEPDLSTRERTELGMSISDSSARIPAGMHIEYISAKDRDNPKFAIIQEHQKFVKRYHVWLEAQPEWQAYKEALQQRNREQEDLKQESFTARKLNKPGTLVETADGQVVLIGHMNALGGVCDDCRDITDATVIKRYAVLSELILT